MILGIGVDLVDIAGLEQRLNRTVLLNRVFSDAERAYADAHPRRRNEILAARWAAKEAFAKALGTGLRAEWPLEQIEVAHEDTGCPILRLGADMQQHVPEGATVHLSLSHTPAGAVAFVVIERG